MDNQKCVTCLGDLKDLNILIKKLNRCSHWICQKCVFYLSTKSKIIICPIDGSIYNESNSPDLFIFPIKILSSSSRNISTTFNSQLFKKTESFESKTDEAINSSKCPIHDRIKEVICFDHGVKICTNCGLFGDHKNHNIISEEEYTQIKEDSLERMKIVSESINLVLRFSNKNSSYINLVKQILEQKKQILKKNDDFFEIIKKKLNELKLEIISDINKRFELIEDDLKSKSKAPEKIVNLTEKWKEKYNSILAKKEQIFSCVEIEDIVKQGENIKRSLESISQRIDEKDFLKKVEDIKLDFNLNLEKELETLIFKSDDAKSKTEIDKKLLTFGKSKDSIMIDISYCSPQKLEDKMKETLFSPEFFSNHNESNDFSYNLQSMNMEDFVNYNHLDHKQKIISPNITIFDYEDKNNQLNLSTYRSKNDSKSMIH